MIDNSTFKKAARIVAIGLIALILSACGGKNWFSYTGREAKPGNRYALEEGGPHAVIWHSPDFELHYRYTLDDDKLSVEGQVVRQNRIKHFHQLKARINIHMLDADGIILDSHRLWSQNGSNVYGGLRWTFQKSWPLPPGNRAVGFSFTGTAGDSDTDWEFWQTP